MEAKRYYRVMDLAKMLGVSRTYVYALIKSEQFPAYRVSTRVIMIPADEFDEWLKKREHINKEA